MQPIEYTSKTPFEVWCIFRNDSDGYTYSCEVLTGIFLTQDDAETALLKLIDEAKVINDIEQSFRNRMSDSYKTRPYKNDFSGLQAINTEHTAWRNTLPDDFYPRDHNITNYEIRPVELDTIL